MYVNCGLSRPKDLFINKYWYFKYNKNEFNYKQINSLNNSYYFRLMEYKNKMIDEIKFLRIRSFKKTLHFSKIWILKYQSWLIINLYLFQPVKKKNTLKRKISKNFSNFFIEKKNLRDATIILLIRYKIVSLMLVNKNVKNLNYYSF